MARTRGRRKTRWQSDRPPLRWVGPPAQACAAPEADREDRLAAGNVPARPGGPLPERSRHPPARRFPLTMVRLQSRIFWLLVLLAHAVAAAAWWLLMPRGFPLLHPHFWVNQILPPVVIAAIALALLAARRGRLDVARAVLISLAVLWLSGACSARVVFPVSFRLRFLVFVAAAAVVAAGAVAPTLRGASLRRAVTLPMLILGAAIGVALPLSQRAGLPGTRPRMATLEPLPLHASPAAARRPRGFSVNVQSGLVTLQRGRYVAYVEPLLTFRSRSPDRCWTMFAPPAERMKPLRMLTGFSAADDAISAWYEDPIGCRSRLDIREASAASGCDVDCTSHLPGPVFSHLNTYAAITLAGHRKLTVTFSPCPQTPVEVRHLGYPLGAPARFAYLAADGTFRIAEAASGEKGPFRTLAEGPMGLEDPLTVTLHDEGAPLASLELKDWAAQASTAVSPTAGWGVPVNAIEFSLDSEDPRSPASFFVTLAATSVGRGFSSVGHAAGAYRNRLLFRWQGAAPEATSAPGTAPAGRGARSIAGDVLYSPDRLRAD